MGTNVWSSSVRKEEVGADEQHLPGGVLLFWAKCIKSCVIVRRKFWAIFVRRVLDSLAVGSDLGMPPSLYIFLTQVSEHNIPFEQIRNTVLDQMSAEDPRYPLGDRSWCALLLNLGYEPENSHTRIMMPLIRDKEDDWIPKAQIDGTAVERLSMTVSEWKAFFERSDWKFNLPLAMGGYEKIDEQAFASSGMVTTNEDYVLQYMDILSAVSKGNVWEFRLSTSNGEFANKYTVTSLTSAWSMLGTMRRKGVVRWACWVKMPEA